MANLTPKIASFFWSNQEIHWLRWAAPVTFKLHHPDWEVRFYTDAENPPTHPGIKVLPIERPSVVTKDVWDSLWPAAKSDLWRWWQLTEVGGLYADTDVIFIKSFEPLIKHFDESGCSAGITLDVGTKVKEGVYLSIGIVTAQPGCTFFSKALNRLVSGSIVDHQDAGTVGLVKLWRDLTPDVKLGNIPGALVYPFDSRLKMRLWASSYSLPEKCLALHWYGSMKGLFVGPYNKLQMCPVKEALIKAKWPV